MPSILDIIRGIYRNLFKCIYLKNQTAFLNFFIAFLECREGFEHLEKNLDPQSLSIPKLFTPKNVTT